ncbi:MAG: aminodeoxychorismate synthase component I [Pyrinomonadaceae bacterium]|nr:aminodeoxychorismate synthase component I [Pyrinomonadaceae bacterium]
MLEVMFGSSDPQARGLHLRFTTPLTTYSANQLAEVVPVLKAAEAAAKSGAWAVLMLSYEAAPAFDRALKTHSPGPLPLAWAAVFDNPVTPATPAKPATPIPIAPEFTAGGYDLSAWEPQVRRPEYEETIRRIRDLITIGDTYQVNYTFPLRAHFNGDPGAWYNTLCTAQGGEYCAYLDLGRYKVLCISPELFFRRSGDSIKTKPMKGTVNRGRWGQEDEKRAQHLAASDKDRAENVMIVDLLRNDLGKISVPGSVKVSKLFEVERYETLWQMTSTVESTLRSELGLADVMTALFPCGSITGAPKIRTTEIIRELEPCPRGIYTGTIGFIRPGGDCVFNVAIRTVVLDSDTKVATFAVGGGVTIDSTAEGEYDECLLKSSFLTASTPRFRLFESMLLENGELFLLSRHLDRLRASAKYFNFKLGEDQVLAELDRLVARCSSERWKIRLLLSKDGGFEIDPVSLGVPASEPLRVTLAAAPVDSQDRFLFHKTTNRTVYEQAVAQRPDFDDVILWNERGEITESSVANIVLLIDGEPFTPPQDSGLLGGTFREELLADGTVRERIIHIEELRQASSFFLINSVRKWMPAVLVD